MQKRFSKNDLIFIGITAAALFAVLFFFSVFGGKKGSGIEITIDGVLYGSYPLDREQEIPIVIDGRTANVLVISDGEADMIKADCPDRLCVHQKAISKNNESIVCLPNRVVVRVTGGTESEFDTIAE